MAGHNVYATYAVAYAIASRWPRLVAKEALVSALARMTVEKAILNETAAHAAAAMAAFNEAFNNGWDSAFEAIVTEPDTP